MLTQDQLFRKLVSLFNGAGIEYALSGDLVRLAQGQLSTTGDVRVLLRSEDAEKVMNIALVLGFHITTPFGDGLEVNRDIQGFMLCLESSIWSMTVVHTQPALEAVYNSRVSFSWDEMPVPVLPTVGGELLSAFLRRDLEN